MQGIATNLNMLRGTIKIRSTWGKLRQAMMKTQGGEDSGSYLVRFAFVAKWEDHVRLSLTVTAQN